MVQGGSSSRVVSNKSRSRMSCDDTSVRDASITMVIDLILIYTLNSRIRNMQNMQIAGHAAYQGESYFLHGLRVVWQQTEC